MQCLTCDIEPAIQDTSFDWSVWTESIKRTSISNFSIDDNISSKSQEYLSNTFFFKLSWFHILMNLWSDWCSDSSQEK